MMIYQTNKTLDELWRNTVAAGALLLVLMLAAAIWQWI